MTIALVCPDGFSILLFCRGIIGELQRLPGARVLVVTDPGEHAAEIETLGVRLAMVPISRFIDPLADLRYVRDLRRVFLEERCDVVLNFSTKPNLYGAVAARLARVPHVVTHVVGLGASFLTLIVAETVGVEAGLGWYLNFQKGYMEYWKMYGALLLSAVFFSTLMTLLFKVRDYVLRWQKGVVKW